MAKKLPQRPKLSTEEQNFCIEWHQSKAFGLAYDAGWPDNEFDAKEKHRKADALLKKPRIQQMIAFLDLSAEDQAYSVIQTEIATGDYKKSSEAAKALFAIKAKLGEKAALDQWIDVMMDGGAQIIPVGDAKQISVADVFRGSAQIAIPLAQSSESSNGPEHPGTN